jgi:hypothetical protein
MADQPRTPHERQITPSSRISNERGSFSFLVARYIWGQLVRYRKTALGGLFVGEGYAFGVEFVILESVPGGVTLLLVSMMS